MRLVFTILPAATGKTIFLPKHVLSPFPVYYASLHSLQMDIVAYRYFDGKTYCQYGVYTASEISTGTLSDHSTSIFAF